MYDADSILNRSKLSPLLDRDVDPEMQLMDYLERSIFEYESLINSNNFKNDLEREEATKLLKTLREQLEKLN